MSKGKGPPFPLFLAALWFLILFVTVDLHSDGFCCSAEGRGRTSQRVVVIPVNVSADVLSVSNRCKHPNKSLASTQSQCLPFLLFLIICPVLFFKISSSSPFFGLRLKLKQFILIQNNTDLIFSVPSFTFQASSFTFVWFYSVFFFPIYVSSCNSSLC